MKQSKFCFLPIFVMFSGDNSHSQQTNHVIQANSQPPILKRNPTSGSRSLARMRRIESVSRY